MFLFKGKIVHSVFIRKNLGQLKSVFSHFLRSVSVLIVLAYAYWYITKLSFTRKKYRHFIKTFFFQETASDTIWFNNHYFNIYILVVPK